MNVSMWIKALRVIPRLDKSEWNGLDVISKWLVSTRAAVLIMTFISAAIAGLLAVRDGEFNFERWLLLAVGLIFAHAINNLLNDLTDFKRGVDKDNYFRTQYGPQPLEQGLMSQRELLTYAAVTGLIALAAGIPLVVQNGTLALGLLLAGAFFVVFYTWPLKYIGLGEITVLLVWGPLMVGGGYFVITGQWDWNVVIASLPYALGVTTVIFGKHIDKINEDRAKGIHTLPVLIGEKAGRIAVMGMIAAEYLAVIYLVITGFFSLWMLIALVGLKSLARVWPIYKAAKPESCPEGYPADTWPLYYVAAAFVQNRSFGMWFLAGLILDVAFRAIFNPGL
ncbi:MAG: prenyltransferase [Anaerolineaceae bacterium]